MAYPATNKELAIIADLKSPVSIFKKNITTEVQASVLPLTAILKVGSAADKDRAEALLQAAKKTRTAVETIRKNVTDPLVAAQKEFIAAEREFAGQLDTEIPRVTKLINDFNNAELKRVREEQRLAAEDAQKAINRKRSEQGVASVEIKLQATNQAIQATAPTGIKTEHVFEGVTDLSLVPREFLTVDPAKVKEAIKSGRKTIPGLNIVERAVRTGRA